MIYTACVRQQVLQSVYTNKHCCFLNNYSIDTPTAVRCGLTKRVRAGEGIPVFVHHIKVRGAAVSLVPAKWIASVQPRAIREVSGLRCARRRAIADTRPSRLCVTFRQQAGRGVPRAPDSAISRCALHGLKEVMQRLFGVVALYHEDISILEITGRGN